MFFIFSYTYRLYSRSIILLPLLLPFFLAYLTIRHWRVSGAVINDQHVLLHGGCVSDDQLAYFLVSQSFLLSLSASKVYIHDNPVFVSYMVGLSVCEPSLRRVILILYRTVITRLSLIFDSNIG